MNSPVSDLQQSSSASPDPEALEFADTLLRDTAATAAAMASAAAAMASAAPTCDPNTHTQCCGVELDTKNNCWIPCQKRCTFASKVHSRGVICVSARDIFKVAKCAKCPTYAHVDCFILQTSGGVRQASCDQPWTCHCCQKVSLDASADSEKKETESSAVVYHTLQSKPEIMKQMSDANWKCRSSQDGRMYFECALGTCNVKISAKNQSADTSETGGEWALKNLPAAHACGCPVKAFSSVARMQNVLPTEVFRDIQRLACSACFKSNTIQKFIKSQHNVLVHVKLIANIGYRAREKLFGGCGDVEQLLRQQEVSDCFSSFFRGHTHQCHHRCCC
jgi:hypothetical protein